MVGIFDGELGEKLKWRMFQESVEGQQSTASCVLEDQTIIWCAKPIEKNAKPNLELLAAYLRSEEPMPASMRLWLADLMDPNGTSELQFKHLSRRTKGAKRAGISNNWNAAQYALRRMDVGNGADGNGDNTLPDKWEQAVRIAAERFGISESSVETAIKSYRAAKLEHDAIT